MTTRTTVRRGAIGRVARVSILATLAVAIAACGTLPFLPPAPPLDHLDPGATPPPGGTVRVERATLEDGDTAVHLDFTGGRPYDPGDPCSTAYVGWAAPDAADREVLHVLVVDVTPRRIIAEGTGCDAVGHARSVRVTLGEPFAGERIVDDAENADGATWFVRPPRGLAVVPELPAGWQPGPAESLAESPGGRWLRTFVGPGVDPTTPSGPGTLQVIQGFGAAAGVGGGDEQRDVTVNGSPAVLYREPAFGELVLVWRLGLDGMALIANEADMTAAALLDFAEGIRAP